MRFSDRAADRGAARVVVAMTYQKVPSKPSCMTTRPRQAFGRGRGRGRRKPSCPSPRCSGRCLMSATSPPNAPFHSHSTKGDVAQ